MLLASLLEDRLSIFSQLYFVLIMKKRYVCIDISLLCFMCKSFEIPNCFDLFPNSWLCCWNILADCG